MSETLGYRDLFDREFYSCRLGVRKPDVAYFEAIARDLAEPPGRLLLLDDSPLNVAAAKEAGLHAARFHFGDGAGALRATLADFGIEWGA